MNQAFTFARLVPPKVSRFWSAIAYGAKTMLMIANDLKRHSRGDRHADKRILRQPAERPKATFTAICGQGPVPDIKEAFT